MKITIRKNGLSAEVEADSIEINGLEFTPEILGYIGDPACDLHLEQHTVNTGRKVVHCRVLKRPCNDKEHRCTE